MRVEVPHLLLDPLGTGAEAADVARAAARAGVRLLLPAVAAMAEEQVQVGVIDQGDIAAGAEGHVAAGAAEHESAAAAAVEEEDSLLARRHRAGQGALQR